MLPPAFPSLGEGVPSGRTSLSSPSFFLHLTRGNHVLPGPRAILCTEGGHGQPPFPPFGRLPSGSSFIKDASSAPSGVSSLSCCDSPETGP